MWFSPDEGWGMSWPQVQRTYRWLLCQNGDLCWLLGAPPHLSQRFASVRLVQTCASPQLWVCRCERMTKQQSVFVHAGTCVVCVYGGTETNVAFSHLSCPGGARPDDTHSSGVPVHSVTCHRTVQANMEPTKGRRNGRAETFRWPRACLCAAERWRSSWGPDNSSFSGSHRKTQKKWSFEEIFMERTHNYVGKQSRYWPDVLSNSKRRLS